MLQEVTAVDGIVEVLPLVVAELPRLVIDAVDPALGAHAVGAFHGREAHQIDIDADFRQLHGSRQSGQTTANDHDS